MGSGPVGTVQGGVVGCVVGGAVGGGLSCELKKVDVAWSTPAGSVLGGQLGWAGWMTCWRGGMSVVCGC